MTGTDDRHLTAEDLVALLAGDIRDGERTRLEAHLASCGSCCDEFVEMGQVERARRRAKTGKLARVALPLVAVFAGLILVLPGLRDATTRSPLRSTDAVSSVLTPDVVASIPEDAATIDRHSLRFEWRAVASDALYTLTVSDLRGRLVWRAETRDTLLVPGGEVDLRSGERYLWSIEALLPTGDRASMDGLRRLSIR